MGNEVAILVNDHMSSGPHEIIWNTKNISSSMFVEAKYYTSKTQLKNKNPKQLETYITEYPNSGYLKKAINDLIYYSALRIHSK